MERFISNPPLLLLLFIVLVFSFEIILVRVFPLSAAAWKKIEYFLFMFAALGIIAAASDIRIIIELNKTELARARTTSAYVTFRSVIGTNEPPSYICRIFNRSEYSPSNFDEIEKEYDFLCEWNKELLKRVPKVSEPNYPELKIDFPQKDIKIEQDYLAEIKRTADSYNVLRSEFFAHKQKSQNSELELFLMFISPFLLVLTLALGMTKVSNDIKIDKVAKNKKSL